MKVTKNKNNKSIFEENKSKNNQSSLLEIFLNEWKKPLSNMSQK